MSDLDIDRKAPVRSEQAQADHPEDFYPTPAWVTRVLFDAVADWPIGLWLEPCAGHGAIVRAVGPRPGVRWDLVELREEARPHLEAIVKESPVAHDKVEIGNYLHRPPPDFPYAVGITNPPFSIAERILGKMMQECRITVCLLEASFLGSKGRSSFLQLNPPDVVYLSERPSFTDGGTGQRDYAWFMWGKGLRFTRKPGQIVVASRPAPPQGSLWK